MINKLARFLVDSVDILKTTDYTCCKFDLDNNYAVFVGWADADAEDSDIMIGIKIRNDYDWPDYKYLDFPVYKDTNDYAVAEICITEEEIRFVNKYIKKQATVYAKYLLEEYEAIRLATDNKEFKNV